MLSSTDAAVTTVERARLIHRELLQIVVLMGVAAAAFVLIRGLEDANQAIRRRDAAVWYRRGSAQLESGAVDAAVDSFRRATAKSRTDQRYVIALADALARTGRSSDARSALLAIREAAPEDAEVNLQLARIAGQQGDVTEALRFYQSTLYAPSTLNSADLRRRTRLELIRFLLSHGQSARAGSELLAVTADLPDTATAHVEIGELFRQVGEPRRALAQFVMALRLEPRNADALAGAGGAAFTLADYAAAARYLDAIPSPAAAAREQRDLVGLIITRDPLAGRIRAGERARRLDTALRDVRDRVDQCLAAGAGNERERLASLSTELGAFAADSRRAPNLTPETIEDALDLIVRAERQVVPACPPVTPLDTAFLTIGHLHGAAAP